MSDRQITPADIESVRQQIELLKRTCPELEGDDEDLRADMVEGVTSAFELLRKVESLRREADRLTIALNVTIENDRKRLERFERREERMRELIQYIMNLAEIRRAVIPEATFTIRPCPSRLIVTDQSQVPPDYIRITAEVDKQKIKDLLKHGGVMPPGVVLSNQHPVLSISTK